MRTLSRIIIGTAATLVATTSIAFAQTEECLPTAKVVGTQFSRIIDARDSEPNLWALISNNIEFNNQDWNVVFVAKLNGVESEPEAMDAGQAMFDSISLEEPQASRFGDRLFCIYASVDQEYAVVSTTPPVDDNNMVKMTYRFKK